MGDILAIAFSGGEDLTEHVYWHDGVQVTNTEEQ